MIKLLQRMLFVTILFVMFGMMNTQAQLYLVGDATPGGWDLCESNRNDSRFGFYIQLEWYANVRII